MDNNYESLRTEKLPNGFTVRLFSTFFIHNKWINGVSRDSLKRFLVLCHPSVADDYVPVWNDNYGGSRVVWWSPSAHEEIKGSISNYDSELCRVDKDRLKLDSASKLLSSSGITHLFMADNRVDAERFFVKYCNDNGNVSVCLPVWVVG